MRFDLIYSWILNKKNGVYNQNLIRGDLKEAGTKCFTTCNLNEDMEYFCFILNSNWTQSLQNTVFKYKVNVLIWQ